MDSRVKIYTTISAFGLIWIVLLVIALGPLINSIKAETEGYRASQVRLVQLDNQWQYTPELLEEYERLNQHSPQLSSLFLKKEEALKFIEAVEVLGRQTIGEFDINNIESPSTTGGKKSAFSQGIRFRLEFSSNFNNAMMFLAALENLNYFVEVEKIQFRRLTNRDVTLSDEEVATARQIKGILQIKVLTGD
jgi:hypothetical protein